ncbi:tetratricopeptide repeat protein [Nguyenibacter vanlangensis]|uniref:Tetratricopeptide repeat protein n=1 Tax=Nguyenibacter vanlangensis TaxID=1216886 RepID=A0ABZ3D3N0_9PROT
MQRFRLVCTAMLATVMPLAVPFSFCGARAAASVAPVPFPSTPLWPDGLSGAFLVGTVAAMEGDDAVAGVAFRQAYRLDPARPVLLQQAFLYSALAGDSAAAGLAARLPGQLMAELVMGDDALLAGRWADAQAHYDRAPRNAMLAVIRPILQAWTLLGSGDAGRALSVLDPWTADRSLGGYYAVHAALIADAAGLHVRADAYFRAALAASPGHDLFSTRAVGHWLVGQGRRAQALQLVDRLAVSIPALSLAKDGIVASLARTPAATPRQGIAQAYAFLSALIGQEAERLPDPPGQDARVAGLRDLRMLLLRFALTLDPAFGQARLMLSALQYDAGQAAAARDTIAQAASSDPLGTVIRVQQARLDAATGRADDAARILHDLVRAQPGQSQLWQVLGDVQSARQDWPGAIESYSRAVAARGRLSGDDWTLLFGRAVALDRADRWPQAQADLQHALDLAPNEAILLNYLGYSLAERGSNLPRAETMLRRAVAIDPQDAAIRDSLGWVLVCRGRVAEGLGLLERAAEQTPEDPAVNYHLGVAYWKSGRKLEAVNQWHVAQLLPAEPSDARKIRAALADAAREGHDVSAGQGRADRKKD